MEDELYLGGDEAADVDAFLRNLKGEPEATPAAEQSAQDTTAQNTDETERTSEEPSVSGEEVDPSEASSVEADTTSGSVTDDSVIKVKIGNEERDFTIASLKELAARQHELQNPDAQVVQARQAWEVKAKTAEAALNVALKQAKDRFAPYENLDYLKLSRQLDEATWDQLRKDALDAQRAVQEVEAAIQEHTKTIQETTKQELQQAAKAAVGILSGPVEKGGIEGWNQTVYNDIVAFATSQGIPKEVAYSIVDPAAIRMMHMAMLYSRGKAAATQQITKVKTPAPKVAAPGASGSLPGGKASSAISRLSKTGSDDDAVDAFMASLRG